MWGVTRPERKKLRAVAPVFLNSRVVASKQRRDKAGKIEICRGRCEGIADRERGLRVSIATVLVNETLQLVRESDVADGLQWANG
jgi:hypothetical protein